jgi:hypothetical protein
VDFHVKILYFIIGLVAMALLYVALGQLGGLSGPARIGASVVAGLALGFYIKANVQGMNYFYKRYGKK